MDLIGGYLLVILILFTANISLLLGNLRINNIKLIAISFLALIVSFVVMNLSTYLKGALSFLLANFSYFFIMISILVLLTFVHYFKNRNLNFSIVSITTLYIILLVCLSSQSSLSMFDFLLYSLFGFITLFLVYQITKLLVHAKRDYPVIIGEYMCLSAILLFIFGLTYNSTMLLDYSMFSPFLILTPTYQLIYVMIGIIIVMVMGVVLNDNKGGSS